MSTASIAHDVASLIQQQGADLGRATEQIGAVYGGAFRDAGAAIQQSIATATDPKRQEFARQQQGRAALADAIKTVPPNADGSPNHQAIVQTVSAKGFPDIGEAWLSTASKNAENLDKLDQFHRAAVKATQEFQAHQIATIGDAAYHADTPEKFIASVGYLAAHGQLGQTPQENEQQANAIVDQAQQGGPDGWKTIRDKFLQHSPLWLEQQKEANKPVVLPATPKGGAPAQQVVNGKVIATGATPPPDPADALRAAAEAETARHNKETERISGLTAGREVAAQQETARHNREMEKAANPFGAVTTGGTGTGATGPTGDDFLKTLPGPAQAQVKALAEGRTPFPTGMSYAKLQPLIAAVTQYDPTFDAANYTARSKARSDLTSPSGTGGKIINSLNTAVQHAGKLSDLIEALDNGDTPMLNAVSNWFSKETGSPKVTNFEAVQPQLMKEIERLWRGAGGSEGDINALKSSLSTNAGKQQQREALGQFMDLLKGKLDATEQQRDNILGPAAKDVPVLFESNKPVLEKVARRASGAAPTASGMIEAVDPQGNVHHAPAGTPLPAGWKLK